MGKYYFHASSAYPSFSPPGKKVYLETETSTLATNTVFTYALTSTFTPALAPHEVIVTNLTSSYHPPTIFKGTEIGGFATITFTRINDKRADGTFGAKVTR